MKAIMVTFDSLNRRMLPNYGNNWVQAPAFAQLGERCTTFDTGYVGSMPCMPARREMHTGRENFLHCPWSPLEPYDDSLPEILGKNGIYSHLATDHVHYWEDAGFAYHNRYSSYRFSRGQEGDPVYPDAALYNREKDFDGHRVPRLRAQDAVNRQHFQTAEQFPQAITFAYGLDFLHTNHQKDNWFLHIETFDPHEPFFAPPEFRALYGLNGLPLCDWPDYAETDGNTMLVDAVRKENAALISFCSYNLQKVLDAMDAYALWEDTLLIVNTDHGFLLGEHGWFGKNICPYYNEIAHIPLFVHCPNGKLPPGRDGRLVQTVDLPPTILDWFGLAPTPDMTGFSLLGTEKRKTGIFGIFAGHANITDGHLLYMRAPDQTKIQYAYSMAALHFGRFNIQSGRPAYKLEMGPAFSFSKGYPLVRVEDLCGDFQCNQHQFGHLLFNLNADPNQLYPIRDTEAEARMLGLLEEKFGQLDAPEEVYSLYGLG